MVGENHTTPINSQFSLPNGKVHHNDRIETNQTVSFDSGCLILYLRWPIWLAPRRWCPRESGRRWGFQPFGRNWGCWLLHSRRIRATTPGRAMRAVDGLS